MLATANPEINVEDLMRRIRQDVAQCKVQIPPSPEAGAPWTPYVHTVVALPRLPENSDCIASKPEYSFAELLNYEDDCFIGSAYLAILRRKPDPTGHAHFLHMLRASQLSKAEILGRLRYSPEGKVCATPVRGLLLPFLVQSAYHIPVLGYGVALTNFVLRLPVIIRNRVNFEANTLRQQREQVGQINALAAKIENVIGQVQQSCEKSNAEFGRHIQKRVASTERVEQLASTLAKVSKEVDLETLRQKAAVAQLEALATQTGEQIHGLNLSLESKATTAQIEALVAQTGEKVLSLIKAVETKADNERLTQLTNYLVELVQCKAGAVDLAAAVTRLGEELAQKASVAQVDALAKKADVAEEDHQLDAFYVSFEDRFRGTREDIKQRVAVYLPVVRDAKAGAKNAPILDVGCGRGEWLELLNDNHLVAHGVDLNRVMVSQCQELGLEVTEAEAIAYLRKLKTNSLGAVTGMHIIEHIPFKRLIALFDEVLRVLKPGGVAIFETPNPENLIVGACNFYYDPTHLNPLPPESMKFVMEARGFGRIEVMRLHPQPEAAMLREGAAQVQQIVNGLLFGAQDYSLVAFKS